MTAFISENDFINIITSFKTSTGTCIDIILTNKPERFQNTGVIETGDSDKIRTHNHLVRKRTFNYLAKLSLIIYLCCEYLSVRCIWLYVIIMSRMNFRVNPHSIVCLNVKELHAWSRCHIWSLSDSSEIRTYNHLIRKRTLNHLAKLARLL